MADLFWVKGFQFFDSSGDPLNGGLIKTFDAGTDDARTVYKDDGAATPWTQPITLDSAGRLTASVYVPSGDWKFKLTTAADTAFATPIITEDDIPGAVAAVDATYARPETPVITKATSYTVVAGDVGKLIQTDATGGDIEITLISAVTAGTGGQVWVQQTSSAGKTTVVPTGAQTINGAALISLDRRYGIIKFISDGAVWTASEVHPGELTLASATTTDVLGAASDFIAISGTTTITSFGTGVNKVKFVRATGAFTITHNATSLILPSGVNITTVSGDTWIVVSDASSNARVFGYQRSDATPVAFTPVEPQGRLTLTTATPVLSSDVTAATSIFYTPYKGLHWPAWDGLRTVMKSIGAELTLALSSNAAHVGYHESGKNFDLFLFDSSGTIRLVSGPAWTNDTTRASALAYKNGFLTNNASMTARFGSASGNTVTVGANLGTYVGTFRASANGQTEMTFRPTAAAGGTANKLYLWNMYNRINVAAVSRDSTNSWSYSTATWRSANGNDANRISIVQGLDEEAAQATYAGVASTGSSAVFVETGIGLDSTSAFAAGSFPAQTDEAGNATAVAQFSGLIGLGFHFVQALEKGAATTTWYGDNNAPLNTQMALMLNTRM